MNRNAATAPAVTLIKSNPLEESIPPVLQEQQSIGAKGFVFIWIGIKTYLGALAFNSIVEYLTGFSSWTLWYAAFAIVQIVNTAHGMKAVENWLSLPCRICADIAPSMTRMSPTMSINPIDQP
jgi:hypothetical protein